MKTFSAKTVDEAISLALLDLGGQSVEDIIYEVIEEKKGLFSKKATIRVYEVSDIIEFATEYLKKVIESFEITPTFTPTLKDDIVRITIDSNHNSILIGKNGRTLQALNELVKLATSTKFKKRIRILLDINDYKDGKYHKIISIAKRTAREVQKTHTDATLEAMPADERRIVHNTLGKMPHIKTESVGNGHHRQVMIKYID
ncbi:MAG TPA: RNA-binding cell elongation regulator Jag/EloR [Bacilli bacterium]|nr:RNA-binding cell elongation regulator Jag/EloR [Bacilli bacterium]